MSKESLFPVCFHNHHTSFIWYLYIFIFLISSYLSFLVFHDFFQCNALFIRPAPVLYRSNIACAFSLIVCNTDDNPELEKIHIQRLLELHVEGLIINTTCMNDEYIEKVSHLVPIVLVSRKISIDSFEGDFVGSNNF